MTTADAVSGPVLFTRYAYPPNSLGYCGPPELGALLRTEVERRAAGDPGGTGGPGELAAAARRFDGAWPYLEVIASANGLDDPLDTRVVEAYWVGNSLLDAVEPAMLLDALGRRHPRVAGPDLGTIASGARRDGLAHHSFQVFAVYPWLALLRAGARAGAPALEVLDRCRIRWGVVEAVDGDTVTVRSRALGFDGRLLELSGERVEQVRNALPSLGLTGAGGPGALEPGALEPGALEPGALGPGDVVSLHWDWVCDRLSPGAAAELQGRTARSMMAVNSIEDKERDRP